MTNSSLLIHTTISFTVNMRTNNSNSKLKTIMSAVSKTKRNQLCIFESKRHTRGITLQPMVEPSELCSKFHSKNNGWKLRLKNRHWTQVTSKTAHKSAPEITENTPTNCLILLMRTLVFNTPLKVPTCSKFDEIKSYDLDSLH